MILGKCSWENCEKTARLWIYHPANCFCPEHAKGRTITLGGNSKPMIVFSEDRIEMAIKEESEENCMK